MSGSNPSLESQLASDFRRANIASSSASSLGRHGASSLNLQDGYPFAPGLDPRTFQGSAPTSPYGHPQGKAVAQGQGVGREYGYDSQGLPGVADVRDVNPMFRVVSLDQWMS